MSNQTVLVAGRLQAQLTTSECSFSLPTALTLHQPIYTEEHPTFGTSDEVIHVSCAAHYSMFLTRSAKVYSAGDLSLVNLECYALRVLRELEELEELRDKQVCSMKSGYCFTYFLTKNNMLYRWGAQRNGCLSITYEDDDVNILDHPVDPKLYNNEEIVDYSCGGEFVYLLTSGGIYRCGVNDAGQLGMENTEEIYRVFTKLPSLANLDISTVDKVECGSDFTLFKTRSGELYGCGTRISQNLQVSRIDLAVPGRVIDIAAGFNFFLTLGTVDSNFGSLVLMETEEGNCSVVKTPGELYRAQMVTHCASQSAILIYDRTKIFVKGSNSNGLLVCCELQI